MKRSPGGHPMPCRLSCLKSIAVISVSLLLMVQPSFADDLSTFFEGHWTGKGTISPQFFDPPEKARCKIVGTRTVGHLTRFSGRCATVSGSGAIKMDIRKVPGTERYEIKAQLPDQVQPVRMRGSASGKTLTFTLLEPLKQHDRMVAGRIDIVFSGDDSMVMTQIATDVSTGQQAEAISMMFERRQQ